MIYQGGEERTDTEEPGSALSDIYALAQSTIAGKQHAIDSLQALLAADRTNANAAATVAPEIRVLFPNIREIGITTTLVAHPADSADLDTANLAFVSIRRHFTREERTRLAEYLEARLKMRDVRIVEVE